jgi:hypothetical protein
MSSFDVRHLPSGTASERYGIFPLSPLAGTYRVGRNKGRNALLAARGLSRGGAFFSTRRRRDAERHFLAGGVVLLFWGSTCRRQQGPELQTPFLLGCLCRKIRWRRQGRRLGYNQGGPHSLMRLLLSSTPGSFCLGG